MSASASDRNPLPANTSDKSSSPLAVQLAPSHENCPSADPDLARIIDAWPTLTEPIREAMLALVDFASGTSSRCTGRL
jgi:hypothetical protein